MSDRLEMEERLGETMREHLYEDDPPVLCLVCGSVCVPVETGPGRDHWDWACPKECEYEEDAS